MPEAAPDLVPVRVQDVLRTGDRHTVVLREDGGERTITIWIGEPEAAWIAMAAEEVELPRPSSHHLMASLLAGAGSGVAEIHVSRLADQIFYADVVLTDGTRVDARPSDGIALALVTGTPLLVAASVFAEATATEDGEVDADRRALARQMLDRVERLRRP